MKKRVISISVLVFIVAISLFIYRIVFFDHLCRNLERIAESDSLTRELQNRIEYLLSNPAYFSDINKKRGLIYASHKKDHFDLNWDKLDIPIEHASFELKGKNVDYRNLIPQSVDQILIGFGYRKRLVFNVKYKLNHDNGANSKLLTFTRLDVVCDGHIAKTVDLGP